MLDMRILSDPYEEECFLILKSNLPKMKDEDALELYINLKKSYKKDRGLMRYIVSAKLYSVLKRTIKSHFRFNRPLFQTLLLSVHSKA